MTRLFSLSFSLFVAGGLLIGLFGLNNLALVAQTSATPQPESALDGPASTTLPTRPAGQAPGGAARATPTISSTSSVSATSAPAVDPGSGWSLLYVLDGDLWETSAGAPMQLTQSGQLGQPALGEDVLAFVERSRNASDIWLASADAPPQPITRNGSPIVSNNHWASQPVLLPGRQYAYVLGDFSKATTGVGNLAVWELSVDNGTVEQITRPPAYAGGDQDVTFNPHNPQQIIFTRYAYAGTHLVEQLQWLDMSTVTVVPLTQAEQPSRQASYSPDGTAVAFVQHGEGAAEDLYVAQVAVSNTGAQLNNVRRVATGVIAQPVWSQDGANLSYIALTNEQFQIWSLMIQGGADGTDTFGQPRQVTTGASVDATSRPVYMTRDQADLVRKWLADLPT